MKIEFIVTTYKRPHLLRCMLASLVAQTNPNWTAHILIDGPDDENATTIVESFNDVRFRVTQMSRNYNNWGHTPHEIGKQSVTDVDYVIMTNDDNYYVPVFLDELVDAITRNNRPGLVYWKMVHSHFSYDVLDCIPAANYIDLGAYATRLDLAQQIHLKESEAGADGIFVEDLKLTFPNETLIKINKVLFVHN